MSFTRESVLILVVLPALGGGSAKASDSCLSFAASTARGVFTDSGQGLGNSYSYSVAVGDLDGDGDLDAMVANANQPNRVWLNDGAGAFTDSGQALG
ncbi:MAG: FG-GAP-like repeat-containing protein, partial [Phycisphaerales bacterium]